jgi:hypothetical protein
MLLLLITEFLSNRVVELHSEFAFVVLKMRLNGASHEHIASTGHGRWRTGHILFGWCRPAGRCWIIAVAHRLLLLLMTKIDLQTTE